MPHAQLLPLQETQAIWLAQQLVTMTPWQDLAYQAPTLQRYLLSSQSDFESLCLWVDKQPAGVICLRSPWLRGTLLELLAILPDFQQQGWGRWLMQWLRESAKSRQQHNLWTLTSAFNTPAIQFYTAQGFTPIGQLDDFIVEGQHELLLRQRL